MGKPVFNLISEKNKSVNTEQPTEKYNDNQAILKIPEHDEKKDINIHTSYEYVYKVDPITNEIIDTKVNELYDILEKNLILLEEEYLKETVNPSVFNGITNIHQIDHMLSIINYNCAFVGYIISNKLNIINIEDENFVVLMVQYMKVVLYDIISNNFDTDEFYTHVKKLYDIYSHDIEGNYITDREDKQPEKKILTSDDFDFNSPILEKDTRLMIADTISKLISEEIVKYKDQISDMTTKLKSIQDTVDDTKKTVTTNKK